jgi:ssDNA-binding replication factor A large subunit
MDNYDSLVERICKSAGLEKEEIERRIEAKRAKLSGLISKEGAAQIIAAELGISFDNERLKLSELVQGMRRANVIGQITKIFPVREYTKGDKSGKIGSFLLGDDTSNIRTVLWDANHIDLIEKNELKEGDVIEIMNGSIRNGEMHLSGFSDIKNSTEKIENVKTERMFAIGKLKDASSGSNMKIRAVVVQTFEPKHFESKQKEGEKGVLLNIVLDDGTENIRAVMFGETIKKLGLDDFDLLSLEKFNEKKENFLGGERFFSGNFRTNTYFNNLEMVVDNIEEVNVDELVKELEAKV